MTDLQELLERYSPFLKQHWFPLCLAFFGLTFLVYGLISFSGSSNTKGELVFEEGTEASESAKLSIVVDVEGGVLRPGVYHLFGDPRVKDALVAASGLSSDADRSWVAKNLNLAAKLTDGAKVYVPQVGETVKSSTHSSAPDGASSGQAININMASLSELDGLSGIGAVTAQKIIDNRPYDDIQQLLTKKVVGSKVFENIKEKIAVY